MYVDSHCHLDFPELQDDLDGVLSRAREAGIGRMVTISTKVTEFERVRAIAEAHPDIYCSVGIHPHEAASEPLTPAADLVEAAAHPRVVGIGETGLDFYYEHSPREAQTASFREHIAAARETGLPLIVHTRDADPETAAVLEDEAGKGAFPGLIHCFSTGADLARRALDLGFYISLSGILTFRNAEDLRATARQVPMDRLLIETDAPFLAPVPKRGKRNEPSFVVHTAACLAQLKGVSVEEIAVQTTENFFRLFSKVSRP